MVASDAVLLASGTATASLEDARAKLEELAADSADVRALLDFIGTGERPLLR